MTDKGTTNFSWEQVAAQRADEIARLTDEREQMMLAITSLYTAGHWTCDRGTPEQQRELWDRVRDAAGIEPGNAPAALAACENKTGGE